MVNHLQADAGVHASAASDFSAQYAMLKAQLQMVSSINDGLFASLQGDAQRAFAGAHARWQSAGANANRLLDDIAQNVGASGTTYTSADQDHADIFNKAAVNLV